MHSCSASGDESSTAESSEDDDDDFKPSSRPSLVHLNSPQQALLLIYTAEDWPALVNYTEQAKKDVNLDCLQGGRLRKMSDIPESFFDRRYVYMANLYMNYYYYYTT